MTCICCRNEDRLTAQVGGVELCDECAVCHRHRWQPIETAPKGSAFDEFLLFIPDVGVRVGCWLPLSEEWSYSDRCDDPPTHWMPLPAPLALREAAALPRETQK